MEAKFKVGDQVKVVEYGHPCWLSNDQFNKEMTSTNPQRYVFMREWGNGSIYDEHSEIVGMEGVVTEISSRRTLNGRDCIYAYSLSGIPEKAAWYDEEQLELIYRPE